MGILFAVLVYVVEIVYVWTSCDDTEKANEQKWLRNQVRSNAWIVVLPKFYCLPKKIFTLYVGVGVFRLFFALTVNVYCEKYNKIYFYLFLFA